jgi:hypothetical protein
VGIKVLFLLMVLSVAAVLGVALAAFFRVRWHLKAPKNGSPGAADKNSTSRQ